MKKKLLLTLTAMVCVLCCAFGLAACGDNDNPDNSGGNETVAIESIALNKSTLTLDIDGYETLTVTYTPTNATTKNVTWSSSAPTIASVDNTGKVTALTDGEATITATTANNKTASCVVTVNAPAPTDQVNAAQWTQILGSANSFTLSVSADSNETIIKRDGVKIMQEMGQQKVILTKDGENYFQYRFDGAKWTKSSTTENAYNRLWQPCTAPTFFKDDYSSFTYADGKYTAASLDKTSTMGGTVQNVVITFNNGALVSLSFSNSDTTEEMHYEVSNVGTTTIDLPTEFTEPITGMYYMIIQSETGWAIGQDFGVEFNNDGTCNMESAGTYEIENGVITMSFDNTTYYATIDGKILWVFENKADTDDIEKSIQPFYNGTEISTEDRAKIVAVFGDGVMSNNDK